MDFGIASDYVATNRAKCWHTVKIIRKWFPFGGFKKEQIAFLLKNHVVTSFGHISVHVFSVRLRVDVAVLCRGKE